MQQGKSKNLSGAIAGSSNNNYYGKGKGRNTDKLLSRLTLIITILFVLIVLFMYILQDVKDTGDIIDDNYNQAEAAE
jgi:protein translocase SecG subunit